MERAFLNLEFPRFTVVPVENGDSWTTARICEQVVSKYKARKSYPDQIFIWFDREKNPDSPAIIEAALRASFVAAGYPNNRLHCLIPDRMSENIILADEPTMSAELGDPTYSYAGDGKHGKGHIKKLFKAAGKDFKETTHGTRLLSKVRLSRSAAKNTSVASFLQTYRGQCSVV